MAAYRLPPHRRLAARFVTGPAGHFVAGAADWVVLVARLLYARVKRSSRRAATSRERP